jgi:hypothetical protein
MTVVLAVSRSRARSSTTSLVFAADLNSPSTPTFKIASWNIVPPQIGRNWRQIAPLVYILISWHLIVLASSAGFTIPAQTTEPTSSTSSPGSSTLNTESLSSDVGRSSTIGNLTETQTVPTCAIVQSSPTNEPLPRIDISQSFSANATFPRNDISQSFSANATFPRTDISQSSSANATFPRTDISQSSSAIATKSQDAPNSNNDTVRK